MKVNYFDPNLWGKGLGVGSSQCPVCKKIIPVMNKDGFSGNRKEDYLQFHSRKYNPNEECSASEKFVRDFN